MISNSGSAWYLFHGSAKGFFSLDIPLELGWWFSWWFMGWSNGWFKRQQLLQQKPHGTHLLLLLLHRILRSTTDLARDGVNLPAEDPGLPAIDVNIGLPQKRVQFHFECFVFRPKKKTPNLGHVKITIVSTKEISLCFDGGLRFLHFALQSVGSWLPCASQSWPYWIPGGVFRNMLTVYPRLTMVFTKLN